MREQVCRSLPSFPLGRLLLSVVVALLLSLAVVSVSSFKSQLFDLPPDLLLLPNGQPFGGDFFVFYLVGKLVQISPLAPYDWEGLRAAQNDLFGGSLKLHFFFGYPPLIPLLFIPLSTMDLRTAFWVWSAVACALSLLGLFLLTRGHVRGWLGALWSIVALGSFIPFTIYSLAGGQLAPLGILAFGLVYYFLRRQHDLLAGIVLGLSYYKPPIFLFFVLLLVVSRLWRVLAGFAASALVLGSGTLMLVGSSGLVTYFTQATRYVYGSELVAGKELNPEVGIGLLGLLGRNIPSMSEAWVVYAICLLLSLWFWPRLGGARTTSAFSMRFALAVSGSLLFSSQALRYDGAILLVPITLVAMNFSWSRGNLLGRLVLASVGFLFFEFILPDPLALGPCTIRPLQLGLLCHIVAVWIFVRANPPTCEALSCLGSAEVLSPPVFTTCVSDTSDSGMERPS